VERRDDGETERQRREKQREGGLEVDDEDLSAIFQKCRDSTVKPN
jgi:hypothetical protein